MTANERAWHDWLDQELDYLLANPGEPDQPDGAGDDQALTRTAMLLHRLDTNQQPEPDPRFILDLEKQLMPSASHLTVERTATFRNPLRLMLDQIAARVHTERSHHRRTSIFASAISIALIFAIIGATAFVAINGGNEHNTDPATENAAGLVSSQTAESNATASAQELSTDINWTYTPDGTVQRLGSMATVGESVYRLIETDIFNGVEAIDAYDGARTWQYASDWDGRGLAADANGIYFARNGTELVSISPDGSFEQWTVTFTQPIVSFVLDAGTLYVWDESATMTAIQSAYGSTTWQKVTGDPGGPQSSSADATRPDVVPVVSTASADEGGVVAMVSANGNINLYHKDTGTILWSLTGFDPINTRMSIMLDDVLFVLSQRVPGDPTSQLRGYGIGLSYGAINWEIDIDGGLTQPSVYGDDGGMVYVIGDSATTPGPDVFEERTPYVDNDMGRNPWTSDVPAQQESGNGTGGMNIYGVNAFTGEIKWITNSKAGPWVALVRGCGNSCGLTGVTSDGIFASINRGPGGLSGDPFELGSPVVESLAGDVSTPGVSYPDYSSLPDGRLVGYGYDPNATQG